MNVDDIFNKEQQLLKVKIVSYTNSLMTCIDLASDKTLKIQCHTKSIKATTNVDSWEGTWPEIGEQVIMVTNFITSERVLFARKTSINEYRFWDPRSIPFANTVFNISTSSDFKPTQICKSSRMMKDHWICSDGFLCSVVTFNRLLKKYR